MTASVNCLEGQKQEASELEVHLGTRESQVLRQEGRTWGQGALEGDGRADEVEAGRTELSTGVEVRDVTVVGCSGVDAGGAGVRVVGGASVHFLQTVAVDVTTVSVAVVEVAMMVLEPEVLVMVTGQVVRVV
jgi:hypothetical protein